MTDTFPPLTDWADTRATIHHYSKLLGLLKRARTAKHPRWWHIGLRVHPLGLTTTRLPVARGGDPLGETYEVVLNLRDSQLHLHTPARDVVMPLFAGQTTRAFADGVLSRLGELGLSDLIDDAVREQIEDDVPRSFQPDKAAAYHRALLNTHAVFAAFRDQVDGEFSPINFWTHHADLSMEWFGMRTLHHEEDGVMQEFRSQIGFGFAPGDESHPEAYYYLNPWPFEDAFTAAPLPAPATWYTASWQGALLPYSALAGSDGATTLLDTMYAVYAASAARLNAPA